MTQEFGIIGGGLMGATLAYKLAKAHPDEQVQLFEQLPAEAFAEQRYEAGQKPESNYALSSSQAGDNTSRSIRASLQEKNNLDMVVSSRDMYLELQQTTDRPLFKGAPSISVVNMDDADEMEELDTAKRRLKEYGMNHSVYADKDALLAEHPEYATYFANAEYPENCQILFEDGYDAEKNPNGVSGIIDPGAVLQALHAQLAKQPNVTVNYDTVVEDLNVTEDKKAEVKTASGEHRTFDDVTIAAGPWLQQFQERLDDFPKVIANRVRYVEIPLPAEAAMPPCIKGIGMTTMTANLSELPKGGYALKKLCPNKKPIEVERSGLEGMEITAEERDESIADFEQEHGVTLSDEQRAAVKGSSGFVASSKGKRPVMGAVSWDGGDKGESPIRVHGLDNYTMACLCGGAADVTIAQMHGKDEPYKGTYANHDPYNPVQYPQQAQAPATARVSVVQKTQAQGMER